MQVQTTKRHRNFSPGHFALPYAATAPSPFPPSSDKQTEKRDRPRYGPWEWVGEGSGASARMREGLYFLGREKT